ncbi:sigma factor, partial [Streptomyces virginiae]|uniref:sigma factor n=1 Tax=Streptomyces virginiae TaxID=1961 RepID=UPI00344D0F94
MPLSPTLPRTDPEALAELQRDHGRALFGFLVGLTAGDAQRAEDLVQETLVRVWQHPEALASGHDSMRPWLFTVARRLAIDARRARLSRPLEVDPEGLEQAPAAEDAVALWPDRSSSTAWPQHPISPSASTPRTSTRRRLSASPRPCTRRPANWRS